MTVAYKKHSRLRGRPQASFGSLFTSILAPAINAGASVLDSSLAKHSAGNQASIPEPKVNVESIKNLNVPNPVEKPLQFNQENVQYDPTKARLGARVGQRHKCWIGAAIGAATSIAGSLFGNSAQKRQMRAQQRMQDYNNAIQEAQGMTQSLNGSSDAQEAYLKQFRTAARFGKSLGNSNIVITDGGDAQPIGNNTFILRGGSHEDINETGQTGIGINVGGNQIEAEGGEVAQRKNGSLRIFSAQPILGNGMSPAQAILRGYNKDKVFAAQQRFKKNNHLNDDGSKAKHGTEVPYKRIHINEDGTFTDILTGKNYNTSATNGEDVVITGKANHWKEAGKKDTSSYFDPMGAVTFASAAGAPILNFTPSNIVGSIREAKDYNSFMNSFMNNDNGGFFIKDYAEKHPYISFLGNMLGDTAVGGLNNKGIDLIRGRMNYAPYRKLTYKTNKLAKKTGLVVRYHDDDFDDYLDNKSIIKTSDKIINSNPDEYITRLGTDNDINALKEYYKNKGIDDNHAINAAKAAFHFKGSDEEVKRLSKIFKDNPEYFKFIKDNIDKGYKPLNQETVDEFLKRQGRSIRGVHADNLETANSYLTETQKGRFMNGGDRLNTNGGLYTSNSPDIADRFKNPEHGKSNGYIGDVQFDFNVDKTKSIEEQLYDARSQVYFDPTLSAYGYYHPFKHNSEAKALVRENPKIKAIEANYGRSIGKFLPSNERAYLPSKEADWHEVETPVKLNNVDEYLANKNERGRWGAGNTSDDLFISQIPNNTTDFIRDARILLSKFPDRRKEFDLRYNILRHRNDMIKRYKELSNKTVDKYIRYNKPNYEPYKYPRLAYMTHKYNLGHFSTPEVIRAYKFNRFDPFVTRSRTQSLIKAVDDTYHIKDKAKKLTNNIKDNYYKIISPKKYKDFKQSGFNSLEDYDNIRQQIYDDYFVDDLRFKPENEYIKPFRFGGKVRSKFRLGARYKLRNGGKAYHKPNYYRWMHQTADNLRVNPIDSTYDYRAYYNSATPWELANTMYNAKNGHFTDIGKRPNHPTFSNESKYSNSKTPGGNWDNNVFVPSIWQFGNDGNGYRNWYMKDTGEGYFNGRRNVFPRSKKADGGWVKPVYITTGYNGSKRVRQYIAKAEGSDFAKQNRQFKGDAIGAKEKELRNFMGKAYANLNEGQRDALLSYYYNLTPKTFFKQYSGLRDRLINAQTEQEYNDTINAMKNSINVGWNNKKLPGLRNRRAIERSWFGYTNPTAQQLVNDKINQIETIPNDNIKVVTQPQIIEVPVAPKVPAGVVPIDKDNNYLLNGNIKQNLINMSNQFKAKYSCGGTARKRAQLGLEEDDNTIPYGGIPGTDTYSSRMRSGYNSSPLNLLNALTYLDQAQGFADENGNSKYITGIAPTIGRGKPSKLKFNRNYRRYRNEGYVPKIAAEMDAIDKLKKGLIRSLIPLTGLFGYSSYKAYQSNDENDKPQSENKPQSIASQQTKKTNTVKVPIKYPAPTFKPQQKKVTTPQQKATPAKQVATKVTTTKQVAKPVVQQKKVTTPQYKGNVTKGNYQLHDGESKVINGIKYTRMGNTIINHKTNVGYIYDKNGNYTGQADYSKVGKNFNDAFDAARAAGRKDFIYHGGKYNNYSTVKETNAKKEALNRSVGRKRIAKRLGGASRPVKGMYSVARPKAWGGMEVNEDDSKFNNYPHPLPIPTYANGWQAIQAEQNSQDMGGVSPWTKPYKTDTQVPYEIGKDANTPYYDAITPKNNNLGTFNDNNSRLLFGTGDYVSLGADLLSALGAGIINYNSAGKVALPERAGYITPNKLVTTYNIAPQLQEIKRMRDNIDSSIYNNTSSSVAALNKASAYGLDSISRLDKFYADKENKETELLNQDAINQQNVAEKNISNDINYNNLVAQLRNQRYKDRANALNVTFNGIGQAVNNFITQGRQNYDDEQTMLMGIAASDYATPSRLLDLGVNLSPSSLAGIYRSINNTPNPGDKPKPEDFSSTTEYNIALNKWERDSKAYKQRSNYANLIKSRMSARNRLRYGIN